MAANVRYHVHICTACAGFMYHGRSAALLVGSLQRAVSRRWIYSVGFPLRSHGDIQKIPEQFRTTESRVDQSGYLPCV